MEHYDQIFNIITLKQYNFTLEEIAAILEMPILYVELLSDFSDTEAFDADRMNNNMIFDLTISHGMLWVIAHLRIDKKWKISRIAKAIKMRNADVKYIVKMYID